MPKIFGLNLIGLLATSVAFFFLGFFWFGIVFLDQMTNLMGYTESTKFNFEQPVQLTLGFLNVVVISVGIGLLLKWLNVNTLMSAVKYGLIAAVTFGMTTTAYGWIYGNYPIHMAVIDGAYTLVGYAMVAGIWSFFSD